MKLKNILILAFLLACVTGFSMSSVSAKSVSQKLENQGGTFTWEDNSDAVYLKRLYSGFGLGRTVKIGKSANYKLELILDEFDGWFKDYGSSSARFYYKVGYSETCWTDYHTINKGDNVTIKTNSAHCDPWIEYFINGVRVDTKE
jgi:hypothetical protein